MEYIIIDETDFFFNFIEKYKTVIKSKYLKDYLEQDFGTGGWQIAFDYACEKTNNKELLTYCEKLQWYDYDSFSCEISKKAIKYI